MAQTGVRVWLAISGVLSGFLLGVTVVNGDALSLESATSIMLPYPPRYQQEYTASCEAASMHIGLAMIGQQISEQQLLDELPVDRRAPHYGRDGVVIRWGNPYMAFVGNVARGDMWPLQGYGVYAQPILTLLLHSYHLTASYGGAGWTQEDVRVALSEGHPVIAWVPKLSLYNNAQTFIRHTWIAWDGTPVPWNEWEHTQVVVGYDARGPFLYNTDSARYSHGQWLWHYTWAQFQRGWDVLGDQAVVIAGPRAAPITQPTPSPSPMATTPPSTVIVPASATATPSPTPIPSPTSVLPGIETMIPS